MYIIFMKVTPHENRFSIFQNVNFQNNGNPVRLNSILLPYTKRYITNYMLVYIGHCVPTSHEAQNT
jgi:hypothetical protein